MALVDRHLMVWPEHWPPCAWRAGTLFGPRAADAAMPGPTCGLIALATGKGFLTNNKKRLERALSGVKFWATSGFSRAPIKVEVELQPAAVGLRLTVVGLHLMAVGCN